MLGMFENIFNWIFCFSTLAEMMEKLYRAENEAMDRVKINTLEHKYPKAFFRVAVFSSLLLFLVLIIWMLTTPYGYPWFIHIVWNIIFYFYNQ